ncbi:MAG TPA: arginine--tRNA ligase [Candidatus Goldiibacteriota bacterium]|nr:arginine--tRNA ligase [Candidatus Goldiibacteriota bacterium]HRQ44344.1 arginine--tRNA ligase [Candidatus Goldiibacteriota bacterium]
MAFNDYLKGIFRDCAKDAFGVELNLDSIKVDKAPAGTHGTYGVNAGFLLSKAIKKSPFDAAAEVAKHLENNKNITEPQAVKPGYVNFNVSPAYYSQQVEKLFSDPAFFFNNSGEGKKINLEFVSANPVGPLVVVSGRAASYGDSLAKLLSMSGYKVTKEDYVNDFGRQMDLFGLSLKERYMELFGTPANIPEGGYMGQYVIELAEKIKAEKGDSLVAQYKDNFDLKDNYFRKLGLEKMIQWQKQTLEKFGVSFDNWFYESELHKNKEVEEAFARIEKRGLFKEEEGAVWFKTTEFGDDKDRVVKKQDGQFTYFASDIAYMLNKFEKRGFDRVINILGPDHHGYIKRMEAIVQGLGYEKEKLNVIILQQVNLMENGEKVKMSKRAGKIAALDDLIEEVGKDAARYFFIMRNFNSHLDFDIELAKEQSDKNPVFYVQYAYARACSILVKVKETSGRVFKPEEADFSAVEQEEEDLLLYMLNMPDVIKDAAGKYAPSVLVAALFELVSKFHSFYNKHRVISENGEVSPKRAVLILALKKTLETCFDIIGITKRERM